MISEMSRKRTNYQSFIWGIILIMYIFLLLYVARFDVYTRFINKVLSPLFAFVVIIRFILLKREEYFPKEFYLQGLFILWSLTGLRFALNHAAFFNYFKILIEAFFLYMVIYSLLLVSKKGDYVFWSLIIVGVALFYNAFVTGDIVNAFSVSYYRAKGVAKNPNEFAYALLMGIWGVLYLWGVYKSKILKILFIGIIVLMIIGIIASASRKTFFTLVLFFIGWLFYTNKEFIKARRSTLLLSVVLVLVGGFVVYNTIGKTSMEERIQFIFQSNESDPTGGRINLYKDGFRVLKEHPIFGVGLGNFVFYTIYGKYTHSDFMEVATNTGVVGFLIYLLIYIILWRRLSRTLKALKTKFEENTYWVNRLVYEVKLMQLIILSHLLIGLGRPHFIDIYSLTLIGILMSYSYVLSKKIKRVPQYSN